MLKETSEVGKSKVVQLKTAGKIEPSLKKLLKNDDIKEFFRFVYENDLRLVALDLVTKKLAQGR